MPLDPRIALQGGLVPDLLAAARGGVSLGQQIREQPFREALMKAQTESAQQSIGDRTPAEIIRFQKLVELARSPDPLVSRAAQIELRTMPGAGTTTGQERIAQDPSLTTQVAQSQAQIQSETSGASEEARLRKQEVFKPKIQAAIKLAEKEAQDRGETLSDLNRMEAGLPGLMDAVSQLKELAPIATSTLGGKAFDIAVKETGFGATKGSTARAKFVAIVDNQVLPLLKETFGAAFTAEEGERLRKTFADPDASPSEKAAQLDAFINQKMRTIQSKRAELGRPSVAPESVKDLSDSELLSF